MMRALLIASLVLISCTPAKKQTENCKAGCELRQMELVGVAFQSGQDDTVCICKLPGSKLSVNDAAQAILPIMAAASAEDDALLIAAVSSSAADED